MATQATTPEASLDNSTGKCLPLPPLNQFRIWRSSSEPIPNGTAAIAAAPSTAEEGQGLAGVLKSIRQDLEYIQKASEKIKECENQYIQKATVQLNEYENHVGIQINSASTALGSIEDYFKSTAPIETDAVSQKISELQKDVTKLKLLVASKYKNQPATNSDPHGNQKSTGSVHSRQEIASNEMEGVPNLCKNALFEHSFEFKDFKTLYDGLEITQKICLLSFSVIPEKEIINKRFMIYWWIGEGFIRPPPGSQNTAKKPARERTAEDLPNEVNKQSENTAEDLAKEVFKQLMAKGFIEPVFQRRSLDLEVNRCRMHPFIRAAVIVLAKRARFFDFDLLGNLTTGFDSLRLCLLAGRQLNDSSGLDRVHMLFNVDVTILDFEKPEVFSNMKNVNVLCLGRWQASAKHHIEVEDPKFLDGLKNMKHLRFLSLQGISRITQLPDSISKLASLTILDLRACPNLEVVPDGIGSLKCLTHLDMSECYLLNNMPKQLSSLIELEVLKGFVVGNSYGKKTCTLEDLSKLPKLRKLSIYTGVKEFPRTTELEDLHKFEKLRKLKIEWGGGSQGKSTQDHSREEPAAAEINVNEAPAVGLPAPAAVTRSISRTFTLRGERATSIPVPELPTQLEKLDLQCFPQPYAPDWLKANKLKKLNKLYIRGGTICDLGQIEKEKEKWEVKILRLKFLTELEMDWRELQELFPKLVYLEKVKCPKFSLFPCDESGVWMRKTEKP